MATGLGRQEGDIVMGNSSETSWADSSVPVELRAPAAARLVQRGVLLAPERTTTCSVSAMRPLGEGLEGLDPGAGEAKEEPKKQGGFKLF